MRVSQLLFCFLLLFAVPAAAQETCPAVVQTALENTHHTCSEIGRNQACYGHVQLSAAGRTDDFRFEQAGDIADVAAIESLSLSAMDETSGTWGIALLRLQANLPDTLPGQNVTVLVFGNVQLENAITSNEQPGIINASARVRSTPDSSGTANVIIALDAGTPVTVDGRNAAGDWVRIRHEQVIGWTAAFLVNGVNVSSLDILPDDAPVRRPMEAFYFSAGIGGGPCAEAESGLLFQTPEGAGQVMLTVNQIQLTLGSTVFVRFDMQEGQPITLVEAYTGRVVVRSPQGVEFVPAGTFTTVALSDDGREPAAAPLPPQPIPQERWEAAAFMLESLPADSPAAPQAPLALPLAEEDIPAAQADFYPGGALNGTYRLTLVNKRTFFGPNDQILCPEAVGAVRTMQIDWDNLLLGGWFIPLLRTAPDRYGSSDAEHNTVVTAPDDEGFTDVAGTWTIQSPTEVTFRISTGQDGPSLGPQACELTWSGVWIGP